MPLPYQQRLINVNASLQTWQLLLIYCDSQSCEEMKASQQRRIDVSYETEFVTRGQKNKNKSYPGQQSLAAINDLTLFNKCNSDQTYGKRLEKYIHRHIYLYIYVSRAILIILTFILSTY